MTDVNPCGIISVCVKSGELRNTSRPSDLSAVPVKAQTDKTHMLQETRWLLNGKTLAPDINMAWI